MLISGLLAQHPSKGFFTACLWKLQVLQTNLLLLACLPCGHCKTYKSPHAYSSCKRTITHNFLMSPNFPTPSPAPPEDCEEGISAVPLAARSYECTVMP